MFFKKVIGIVTAFVCAGLCTVPLTSAAISDPCDVNGDGIVNSVDAMTIYKHLIYNTYYTSYNQLDANQNQIVDMADYYYVLNKVMGRTVDSCFISRASGTETPVEYPEEISGFATDYYNTSIASRQYKKYSYVTHQSSTYTLYPNSATIISQNGDETDGLIDNIDDRIPATGPENQGIVCLPGYGTGFIVGDHVIATAAHVVYDGGFKTGLTIRTYNANGTISSTYLTPVEIHVPKEFVDNSTKSYDYALITVAEDLSNYPQFSLSSSYNVNASGDFSDVPIYVTGCPQQNGAPNNGNSDLTLYTDQGSVYGSNAYNRTLLNYTVDTTGGQSGAPVYTITKQTINGNVTYIYTALAVHKGCDVSECNLGVRMTKYQLQFYNNNSHISY